MYTKGVGAGLALYYDTVNFCDKKMNIMQVL